MRMIRLWKHLHLLKRGAIGMLPGGVNAAQLGSCAVDCPACPRDFPDLTGLADIVNTSRAQNMDLNDDDDDPSDQPSPLLE